MKQNQVVRAYKALKKLANQELPIKISCKIHRLMVSIRPAWDFQLNEEEKILRRLNPQTMENGVLQFNSPEDAKEFRDKLDEIGSMDADDMDLHPIQIPIPDGAVISANDLEALEGFVDFVEE